MTKLQPGDFVINLRTYETGWVVQVIPHDPPFDVMVYISRVHGRDLWARHEIQLFKYEECEIPL